MTEFSASSRRFNFKLIPAFLFRPRKVAAGWAPEGKSFWQLPMLILSILFLARTVVGGYFQAQAALAGQAPLPADWQYWTPDMQNNYMQAQQATQGPVFLYIIPAVTGLAKLWAGWFIVAGLLHLASTLFGGRGSMGSTLNLVAWSCLPFALRDILRIIFMLVAKHTIANPGLSGFGNILFVSKVLGSVDLFLIWFAILLALGLRVTDNLPVGKAVVSVFIVLLIVLLIQGGLGTLLGNLGGMMITRPF